MSHILTALFHFLLLLPAVYLSGAPGLLLALAWVGTTATESLLTRAPAHPPHPIETVRSMALMFFVWIALASAIEPLVALVCLWLGVCVRIATITELGEHFHGGIAPTGPVRSHGMFRLRHPAELGLLLMTAGLAAASMSPIVVGMWGVLVFLPSLARISAEERALAIAPLAY